MTALKRTLAILGLPRSFGPPIKGTLIVLVLIGGCAASPYLENAINNATLSARTIAVGSQTLLLSESSLDRALSSVEVRPYSEYNCAPWFSQLHLFNESDPCLISEDGLVVAAQLSASEENQLTQLENKLEKAGWQKTESGTEAISTWTTQNEGGWMALCQQKESEHNVITLTLATSALQHPSSQQHKDQT